MIAVPAPSLVGCSAVLHAAIDLARRFAPLFHPVLLIGPTGVGKTTLARLIHEWSGRGGEFVAVTGGELVDSLYHNQLFGHEKGSYTGATDQAPGAFERANGGTLLLDELQHWSRDKQSAILAPLQDARVTRVGGRRALPITCRVVLASTMPLDVLVKDDRLLPDLQYRIGDLVIELPRLAERRVDVAVLAYHFLDRERQTGRTGVPALIDPSALERLLIYEWPGNVRELERVVQYAVVRAGGRERIRAGDLPSRVGKNNPKRPVWKGLSADERDALTDWAFERGGSRIAAARLLGLHANTIYNRRRRVVSSQTPSDSTSRGGHALVTSANYRSGKRKRLDTNTTLAHTPTPALVTFRPPAVTTPTSQTA